MLTRHEVETILGRSEDLHMAEIIGCGATTAELIEAKRWAAGYERTLGRTQSLRPSMVIRLLDILKADEIETEGC